MLKKILAVLAVLAILVLVLGFVLSYEGFDVVDVKMSEVKSGQVYDESYYLTETIEDGKTVLFYSLDTTYGLEANKVIIGEGAPLGEDGVFVKLDRSQSSGGDEDTFAIVDGSDFHNGIIEVEMNGSVSPNTSYIIKMFARGFIGIGFRINDDSSSFENIYLRPENGITDDPERKKHAVQYYSYPDWPFDRFRKEAPEQYEAAAPIAPGEWEKVKIEVEGQVAKLYINDEPEPVLVVNDLKLGPDARGKIGLWVDNGTNGFFRNLKITKFD